MDTYINYNGNLIQSNQPVITAENRGFRYGDGVFETIKLREGKIFLASYHFERLFSGMELLQFERPKSFTADRLIDQIAELCRTNDHLSAARVRLMVFRGNGGLYDPENHFPNYIIQTWPLVQADRLFNEKGLLIDIFPDGRKARDVFSNLKSNNYLVYAMAALYAKQRQLDDCLVLNSDGRVCDSTIANIFCIKNGIIYTTALSEGCVAGVMRRHVLEQVRQAGYPVFEKEIDTGFLQDADEIFLTNALQGLRWVKQFRESSYGNPITTSIHAIINKSIHY